jgi:triosephosphate isomerase
MRAKVIAGNWKMHKSNSDARVLAEAIRDKTSKIKKTKIIVCPPATALVDVVGLLKETKIAIGAQNMHWEKMGAFTGEISAEMIKSTGASYVIIGHSERRQFFAETDETVNRKLMAALSANLNPIVCVGETLDQRESGITKKVVGEQLEGALKGLSSVQLNTLVLAYEPVWAIGTGKTATPDQAQEVHAFIRSKIQEMFDRATSESLVIQYGGSVKPDNAYELLKQPDIDGALVGGACLESESFAQIIESAEKSA